MVQALQRRKGKFFIRIRTVEIRTSVTKSQLVKFVKGVLSSPLSSNLSLRYRPEKTLKGREVQRDCIIRVSRPTSSGGRRRRNPLNNLYV